MHSQYDDTEVMLQAVRGERPWTDLQLVGISITIEENSCQVENPRMLVAVPRITDMVQGLIRYADRPQDLRTWAMVILGGSSFLDLRELEDIPEGELLLSALWDASSFGAVSGDVLKLAQEIIKSR